MQIEHKNNVNTQENNQSQLHKKAIQINIISKAASNKFDIDQKSENTEMSSPKHIKSRLSFDDKMVSSISEKLSFNTQKVHEIEKDKKTYQLRCEALINRIEALKKQERDINKKITRVNKIKVSSAKIQAEKLHRIQQLEDIRKEKEEEIRQKKRKAQEERIEEISTIKEISDNLKEEKKKIYERRVKERKRASSYVNECKRQIEEEKKVTCKKIKDDLVNPNDIKTSLRVRKEVKRNSTIEKKIEQEELYTENLKMRLKELEKEEEIVYHQVTNTIKNNENMLTHSTFAYATSDYMTFKANTTIANRAKKAKRTNSCSKSTSSSFYDKSSREVLEIQKKFSTRIKELNQMFVDGKLAFNLKKK